jgi:hypothetical protein
MCRFVLAICIDPKPLDGRPYKPWRLRDGAEATQLRSSQRASAEIASIGGQVVSITSAGFTTRSAHVLPTI